MKTNTPIKARSPFSRVINLAIILGLLSLFSLSGCKSASQPNFSGEMPRAQDSLPHLQQNFSHIAVGEEGKTAEINLMVVTINPKMYELSIEVNKDRQSPKTIREIHTETGSLLTFNGSFFTEKFQSTGLLVNREGELESRSKAALLNGIIAIDTSKNVHFFDSENFPSLPSHLPDQQTPQEQTQEQTWEFAIQNGPVLIRNGEIAVSKKSTDTASRTALGIDTSGNLVVIVVKQSLLKSNNALSLYEFARMLKESPKLKDLNLTDVLNLDGGRSTGLMIGENYYAEMDYVQNVVTVKKRP